MTVAVRVSATVTGHRRKGVREHDLVLALPPGEVTARQLIEAAVTAEVTAYQARAEEASLVRVLTKKSLDADLARGAVRTGGPRDSARWAVCGQDRPAAAHPITLNAVPPDISGIPAYHRIDDHEGFSLGEGFSFNERKILRDHAHPHSGRTASDASLYDGDAVRQVRDLRIEHPRRYGVNGEGVRA